MAYVPPVLLGIVVAGFLAAALSSLDSALNSLSAVSLEEFWGSRESRPPLTIARLTTVSWGLWATAADGGLSFSGATVIELINQVGSLLYGPVLAVFILAWRSRRADSRSAVAGALAGLGVNVALALGMSSVSWLWWNISGCLAALLIGEAFGKANRLEAEPASLAPGTRLLIYLLVGEFAALLALLTALGAAVS